MKKLLIISALALAFYSCGSKKVSSEIETVEVTVTGETVSNDGHNARNSLDYLGIYSSINEEAKTGERIELENDSIFKKAIFVDNSNLIVTIGSYTWNEAGNTIILAPKIGETSQYLVAEGKLIILGANGERLKNEDGTDKVIPKD